MNRDKFKGHWHQLSSQTKEKWSKLTDSDITQINGEYEHLIKALEKRYGYERDRAEKEFNQWHCELNQASSSNESHNHNKFNPQEKNTNNKLSGSHHTDQHNQEKKRKAG